MRAGYGDLDTVLMHAGEVTEGGRCGDSVETCAGVALQERAFGLFDAFKKAKR